MRFTENQTHHISANVSTLEQKNPQIQQQSQEFNL